MRPILVLWALLELAGAVVDLAVGVPVATVSIRALQVLVAALAATRKHPR